MIEKKTAEKTSNFDKAAEYRAKGKQNEEELVELENQRILAVVALSSIDIRQLKDILSGIRTTPTEVEIQPATQELTNKFERKTDDEEDE